MLVYLMCIFGGIVSDVWLGKFKTIFILSVVYAIGTITVSVSAIPTPFITQYLSPKIALIVGLVSETIITLSRTRVLFENTNIFNSILKSLNRYLSLSVRVASNHAFPLSAVTSSNFQRKLHNLPRSFRCFISLSILDR